MEKGLRTIYNAFILILFLLAGSVSADEVILGKDTKKLFPDELIKRYEGRLPQTKYATGQLQDAVVMKGKGKITKIEIVSVRPISGNNPLNQADPINNAFKDGKFYNVAVDELAAYLAKGGGGSGGGGGGGGGVVIPCSPSSDVSDKANLKDSVGCYLKSDGTICRVEKLPSPADLKYEAIFVMFDDLPTSQFTITGNSPTVSDYIMTKPPTNNTVIWPGGDTVYKTPSGTYVAEVKHRTTGALYRINYTVQELPGKNVRVTVNSLTKIN